MAPHPWFHSWQFQLPGSNQGPNIFSGNAPEINKSRVLNCMPFWEVWRPFTPSRLTGPGPESPLCTACTHCVHYLHHQSLSSRLSHQTDCHGITVLVFKSLLFSLTKTPKCKSSDTGNLDMPKTFNACFKWIGKNSHKKHKLHAEIAKIYLLSMKLPNLKIKLHNRCI